MKIKNTHPVYANGEERIQRLADLKKTCRSALVSARKTEKRSA